MKEKRGSEKFREQLSVTLGAGHSRSPSRRVLSVSFILRTWRLPYLGRHPSTCEGHLLLILTCPLALAAFILSQCQLPGCLYV
uniref:Transformation-related gene 6 n=1 Tax=Homo sapiens TaxID=9606 RepID=Q56VW4_HUMAN|nr:transformation-related gene 6 [Homo sapiens]